MAQNNLTWEDLGNTVSQIVDQAIRKEDYQKLDQTIRQTIEKAVDGGTEFLHRTSKDLTSSRSPVREPVSASPALLPGDLYRSTGSVTAGGIAKLLGGILLSLVMFGLLLSGAIVGMVFSTGAALAAPALAALAGLGGGVWLMGSGIRSLNRASRFRSYRKAIGTKTSCTLAKLAAAVGKSEKFVKREILKMIDRGWFLQGHMDAEQTRLITNHETFRQFEHNRLLLEQRQQAAREQRQQQAAWEQAQRDARKPSPQVQEVLDKGDAFLAQIRRCNEAIPGQEISAKISRMERIVERIFDRAERHPEIIPDLKKMMDYYLPMTVKLLNAYADMDAQPVQGQNIQSSKQEIEKALDTLNLAFEKLLDSVFADAALDISSDISVLNTLLAQEGLTENELTL